MLEEINEAVNYIKENIAVIPRIGLILGSGLGELADEIENPVIIDYGKIPHFPSSTAPGHKGRLVIGILEGIAVVVMQGRFHYYEGYDMSVIALPVRVMKKLGVEVLVVTNAAGGVNLEFAPGDLMLIRDHIKPWGPHPLRGPNPDELGPRFYDLSKAYTPELREKARKAADASGINLKEGVYTYFTGPSYETPAEIKMVRIIGGDAVGMSTVPEVLTAAHCGMDVLGISCITNMAAGILDQPITAQEVLEVGQTVKEQFIMLIRTILKTIFL